MMVSLLTKTLLFKMVGILLGARYGKKVVIVVATDDNRDGCLVNVIGVEVSAALLESTMAYCLFDEITDGLDVVP